ncbi:MAG: hypothetical protein AAGA93_03065 [Actinomycetota bacterium]
MRTNGTKMQRHVVVAAVGVMLILAGCGGGIDGRARSERLDDLADLRRCPDPLVIQTDWFPEPEHGALYHLTAGEGRVDPTSGHFRGPLAATVDPEAASEGGGDEEQDEVEPPVTLEIRAGGPFLDDRTPLEIMVDDPDVFLGYVNTDVAIANHEDIPTTAVVAPLEINPQIIMWDPDTYEIGSWDDVRDTDATISHAPGVLYTDFLVGADLVDVDQLADTYDGRPTRFIAQGGALIQQGFATREPYTYENVLVDWGRPVASLLVHDAGYEIYQGPLAILSERLDADARACLAALVPLIQQAVVDFQRDPSVTNELLVDVVDDLGTAWDLTDDGALATVVEMGSLGIVANGSNATVGDFDFERLEAVMATMAERVASVDVPSDMRAQDVATNEFIDPDIGL